jgi:hypothetical protein
MAPTDVNRRETEKRCPATIPAQSRRMTRLRWRRKKRRQRERAREHLAIYAVEAHEMVINMLVKNN